MSSARDDAELRMATFPSQNGFSFRLSLSPVLWMQNGSNENDTVQALAISDNDSVVLVGHTKGNWSSKNVGYYDCVAIKLDADRTMMWAWQVNQNVKPCAPGV